MSVMFGPRLNITMLGCLLALLAAFVAPASARPVMGWDFRHSATPSWQAAADVVDLRQTSDGLAMDLSGPMAMVTLSGLAIPATDVRFVRLRLRVPVTIGEAYFAWGTVREGRLDSHSSPRFPVRREFHGGVARSVWIPTAQLPHWSGLVSNLAVIMNTSGRTKSVVVESVELFPDEWSTQWLMYSDQLSLDEVVDNLVLPLWSLNSVESIYVGATTLDSVASGLACLGLVVVGLVTLNIIPPSWSRRLGRAALATVMGIVVSLAVLGTYLEVRAFQVERRVFGGGPSDDYRVMDRFDLVGIATELKRQFAPGTRMDVCFGESPTSPRKWRIPFELFPLRVVNGASDVFVESDDGKTTCHPVDSSLVTVGNGYRVYQR